MLLWCRAIDSPNLDPILLLITNTLPGPNMLFISIIIIIIIIT